jgi:hypothetical protein
MSQQTLLSLKSNHKYSLAVFWLFIAASIRLIFGLGWGLNGSFNTFPLADSFHFGEFFAATQSIISGSVRHPFVLHGASDILPSLIFSSFTIADKTLPLTIFSYQLLGLISALLFLCLVYRLSRGSRLGPALLLVAAYISTYSLNYRDLFLILALCLYLLLQEKQNASRALTMGLAVGLGLTLGANFYWSFNRGIVSAFLSVNHD